VWRACARFRRLDASYTEVAADRRAKACRGGAGGDRTRLRSPFCIGWCATTARSRYVGVSGSAHCSSVKRIITALPPGASRCVADGRGARLGDNRRGPRAQGCALAAGYFLRWNAKRLRCLCVENRFRSRCDGPPRFGAASTSTSPIRFPNGRGSAHGLTRSLRSSRTAGIDHEDGVAIRDHAAFLVAALRRPDEADSLLLNTARETTTACPGPLREHVFPLQLRFLSAPGRFRGRRVRAHGTAASHAIARGGVPWTRRRLIFAVHHRRCGRRGSYRVKLRHGEPSASGHA